MDTKPPEWFEPFKPVKKLELRDQFVDRIHIQCGICLDHDGNTLLKWLIFDHESLAIYTPCFNCDWLMDSPARIDWIAQVLSTIFRGIILESKSQQITKIGNAFASFMQSIRIQP